MKLTQEHVDWINRVAKTALLNGDIEVFGKELFFDIGICLPDFYTEFGFMLLPSQIVIITDKINHALNTERKLEEVEFLLLSDVEGKP